MAEHEPAETAPAPQGNAIAVVVIVVLALIALGALVGGGYLLVTQVAQAGEDGLFEWADTGGSTETSVGPEVDSLPYPAELEDLSTLTAQPGDSFEGSVEALVVGEDIEPGVYIAPDATPMSVEDELSCYWSVAQSEEYLPEEYFSFGEVEDGTAMMLAPDGYLVRTDPACGTWQAIDPSAAFEGATGTRMTAGQYAVGRDVLPGTYLSVAVVDEESSCYAYVGDHFGFEGGGHYFQYVGPRGGTMVIEVEQGDAVELTDCPAFELADLDALYSADAGADRMDDGDWLVGIDVRAGEYVGPDVEHAELYCSATVWQDHLGWEGETGQPVDDVFFASGDVPPSITLEAGQMVSVRDCGFWERTGP